MAMIENLEAMLVSGQDNALLRFTLGSAFFKQGDAAQAVTHLRAAVGHDPDYSAAWKIYGRALHALGHLEEAQTAFESGICAAGRHGDVQAAKEMKVFLKRVRKALDAG
ncbi:MAG: tetratricopeptide repeat protein [Gammaproteobacteria bacterium]